MKIIEKIIIILTVLTGICISSSLLLLASNIDKLDPLELKLVGASTNLFIEEIKLLIPISILIFYAGIFWSFLPKQTDDPIIRLVKTTGIIGGLLISLILSFIILK